MSFFVGGAIIGTSLIGASSARKGRKAAEAASAQSISEQRRQFDLVQEQTKPYRETGQRALSSLEQMLSGDYSQEDLAKTPGYQFRLDEGYKGLERSQSGRRLGGRAAKEAMRYGQDYASNEFGNRFSRLSQMANYGVGGVAQSTQAGAQTTAGIQQAYGDIGRAGQRGAEGVNEAIQGGAQNLVTWNMYNRNEPLSGYQAPAAAGDAYMPAFQRR